MGLPAPNTAPARCADCAHVVIQAVTFDGHIVQRDRCAHPAGPKPMFDGCVWHKEKAREAGATACGLDSTTIRR